MRIAGIDPGITGAIAVLDGGQLVAVHDLPVTAKATGKGQALNAALLAEMVRELRIDVALLEAQRAMPGQGVTSVFSLGRTMGVLEGVLAAAGVSYRLIEPATWKRAAGLVKADKDQSRTAALQLFPGAAHHLARKKDHGRAEAMLIAWHLARLSTDWQPGDTAYTDYFGGT